MAGEKRKPAVLAALKADWKQTLRELGAEILSYLSKQKLRGGYVANKKASISS